MAAVESEISTVFVLTATNLALTAAMLLGVQRHFRANVRGVLHWAMGNLVATAGIAGLALRDVAHDFFTLVLAISLLPAAQVFFYQAIKEFRDERYSLRLPWTLVVTVLLAQAWLQLVDGSLGLRVMAFSLPVSALSILCAWSLLGRHPTKRNFGEQFTAGLFILQVVLAMGFGLHAYLGGRSVNLFASGDMQRIALSLSEVGLALVTFGFVLMIVGKLTEELNRHATRDPLTGIYNRRAFLAEAHSEFARCRRRRADLALLILDLDHFKSVNDNYGHAAGDEVLRKLVEAVSPCLRDYDVFARWGGEEFVVLLPDTPHAKAVRVAERLRQALMETPAHHAEQIIHCTLSIGVANLGEQDRSIEDLICRADHGLYAAKNAGRNQVVATH